MYVIIIINWYTRQRQIHWKGAKTFRNSGICAVLSSDGRLIDTNYRDEFGPTPDRQQHTTNSFHLLARPQYSTKLHAYTQAGPSPPPNSDPLPPPYHHHHHHYSTHSLCLEVAIVACETSFMSDHHQRLTSFSIFYLSVGCAWRGAGGGGGWGSGGGEITP